METTEEGRAPPAEPRRGEDGASLVELVLGTTAVIILLVAVISMVIKSSDVRRSDAETHLAYIAAHNSLEDLRTVDVATLPTLNGSGFDVPGINGNAGGLTPVDGDPDALPGLLSVTVDKSGAGVTLYRVRATVTWTGARGRQELVLETLMGERKIN